MTHIDFNANREHQTTGPLSNTVKLGYTSLAGLALATGVLALGSSPASAQVIVPAGCVGYSGSAPPGGYFVVQVAGNFYVSPGGNGPEFIIGQSGADVIVGSGDGDIICGLGGADDISGSGGADTIIGGEGADTLRGGFGNDTLKGGIGNDDIFGDGNDDDMHGGGDNDDLDGGSGVDIGTGGPVFNPNDNCDANVETQTNC